MAPRNATRSAAASLRPVPIPELLQELLTAVGPSGHEVDPARVWREHCARFADEVGGDNVGSSWARGLVRIGDVAVIESEPVALRHERVIARALDNRVGCYVAAESARLVAAEQRPPGDVVALAVAQEETSFAGSRTSAFAHEPDVAIVVDLTFATDQPGVELGPITRHTLGSGPVLARGTTLHPLVFELLHHAGEHEG